MRVPPRIRKTLLTAHVATSVGWLGVDLALLTLGIAGLAGADRDVVYPAAALLATLLFAPLSGAVWLIGVLNALLTPWGLVRHRWVVVKLLITSAMLGLVLFVLLPAVRGLGELGGAAPMRSRIDLVVPPSVSSSLLIFMTAVSSFKPWGRTRRGRRNVRAAAPVRPDAAGPPAEPVARDRGVLYRP
ncbi:hypothetical protein ACFFWC_10890 [Plantactinospora siamensis]|uniref:DUF2269 domain-containing protein n=1 Tax=Plantactinospora siamensis TaxID=555372 RepID=A0ABV6P0A2_9ACTN